MINNEYLPKLHEKYLKKFTKKYESKPLPIQLIAARSFNTAVGVLCTLKDIPFHEIANSIFLFCKDSEFRNIAKQFEAQIELAGANEEKFIMEIHVFFNYITSKIP